MRDVEGWPEAISRLMWNSELLADQLAEQRQLYSQTRCAKSVPSVLESMLREAEGDEFYPDDEQPNKLPGACMSSVQAEALLIRDLMNGAREAEGAPEGRGGTETIPRSLWRNTQVVAGKVGFDLIQRSTGHVLYRDVWLRTGAGTLISPSPNKPKNLGGRKPSAKWPDFVAAVGIWMVRHNDDAISIADIGSDVLLNAVSDIATEWGIEFERATFQPGAQRLLERMREEAER